MNISTRRITLLGVLAAVLVILGILESLLLPFLPIRTALITILVIAFLYLVADTFLETLLVGCLFGFSSFIVAVIMGKEAFINPLISVVPRLLTACAVFGLSKLLGRDKYWKKTVIAGSAALFNTVFVLSFLYTIGGYLATGDVLKGTLLYSSLPELIATSAIAPIVFMRIGKQAQAAFSAPKQPVENIEQDE